MSGLTKKDLMRQDYVDGKIFELINELIPPENQVDWDIEMIGDVRDKIRYWLVDHLAVVNERKFYPYISERSYATRKRRKNNRRHSSR